MQGTWIDLSSIRLGKNHAPGELAGVTLVHEGCQNTNAHSVVMAASSPTFKTSSLCTICAEAAGEGDILNTHLYIHRQWTTLTDCDHGEGGEEGRERTARAS